MRWSRFGAFVAVLLVVACGGGSGGVATNNHHGYDAGGGSSGSSGSSGVSGGSGGTTRIDASAGGGGSAGAGATGGSDAGVTYDLCTDPVNNLIAHGTFEEGMNGDVPANWEIRNPSIVSTCASSGTTAQHIFLSAAPTGCTGHALSIDARGQWDCIAIQRASDYNTIVGGATYRISADVRARGNAVNPNAYFVLGAQWLDAQDQFFGDVKNPKTATAADNDYDWKVLGFDVVAPANATRILVWLTAHYPGRVDYDNIAVVKL